MRRTLFAGIFALTATCAVHAGTWQLERPYQLTRGYLQTAHWLDARHGWISGYERPGDSLRTVLLRTTDGGNAWLPQPSIHGALFSDICFHDPLNAELRTWAADLLEYFVDFPVLNAQYWAWHYNGLSRSFRPTLTWSVLASPC